MPRKFAESYPRIAKWFAENAFFNGLLALQARLKAVADEALRQTESLLRKIKPRRRRKSRSARLTVESLEPRLAPATLYFSASSASVSESAGSITVTVDLASGNFGMTTVSYATANGTATAGTDYTSESGSLTFAPMSTSETIYLPILLHTESSNCTFTITLSSPSNASLGSPSTETITIDEPVVPTTPTITWSNPADITYGSGLTYTQLDATASVAGTFAYSPSSPDFLNAGTYTLDTTFTPTDTTDYTTATASVTLVVDKADLTVSGVTASDKTYDGTTTATLPNISGWSLDGVVSGDTITLNTGSAAGTFSDKNVGTSKTVTVSGLTISGSDTSNYSLTEPTANASITAKALTVTGVTASNKTYDQSTSATLNVGSAALSGVVSGESVSLSTSAAAFSDDDVGTGKTVTVSGLTISGSASPNYSITQPTTTANITAKALTVSGITADKVYDQTTFATLDIASASLSGVISGDTVTLSAGGGSSFADKNVANGKTVTVSGLSLSGGAASNYTLTTPSLTADITPKLLTVGGVLGTDKIYDGGTNDPLPGASGWSLTGVISGDTVALNTGSVVGTFADKTVAAGKTVTISGLTISGADAGNYSLTQPTSSADITAKTLTVTGLTADNKTYDKSTTATLNTGSAALSGVVSGDSVGLSSGSASGTFSDDDAGNSKNVTVSGLTLTGADDANYSLTQPTPTANITQKALTVSGITADKVYDKTTIATLDVSGASLTGVISGDTVTVAYSSGSSFADDNVANGKTVTVSGLSLSGGDASNYSLTTPSLTADITPKTLTISGALGTDKVYDGGTNDPLPGASGWSLTGTISGDTVTLNTGSVVGTFSDKTVGAGKTVTVSGLTISGTDSGNYSLTQPSLSAAITAKALTVTGVTASNKTYDKSTSATLNTGSAALSGVVSGDSVGLSTGSASGAFGDDDAGNSKTVTVSGLSLTGADDANYSLTQPAPTANITQKPLTVSGVSAENKIYDQTTTATLDVSGASLSGIITGDTVTLGSSGTSAFADKNVGTGKTVSVTGMSLSGADGSNYSLTQPTDLTANITPKTLTVGGALATDKVYDGSTNDPLPDASGWSLTGVISGDTVNLNTGSVAGTFADKNVGSAIGVTISGLTISGADATNYSLTQPALSANITAAALTVTVGNDSQTYGTPADLAADLPASIATGVDGENLSIAYSSAGDTATAQVGTYAITGTMSNGTGLTSNYNVTVTNGPLTVNMATPTFSSPTIVIGASTTTISGILNANAGSQLVPTGESVSITLNGATYTASVDSSDNFSATFSTAALPPASTPYTITFGYAGDSDFNSAMGSSVSTILSLVNPGSQSNYDGDSVNLPLTATESTGNTLAFSATGLPSGLSINATTGLISGTIASDADIDGPYSVTVTATAGLAVSQTFIWTVSRPAPTIVFQDYALDPSNTDASLFTSDYNSAGPIIDLTVVVQGPSTAGPTPSGQVTFTYMTSSGATASLGVATVDADGNATIQLQSDLLAATGTVVQAAYSGDTTFTSVVKTDGGSTAGAITATNVPVTDNPNIPANAQNLTVIVVCGKNGAQTAQWRDSARTYYGANAYIITSVNSVASLGTALAALPAGSISHLVIGAHGWSEGADLGTQDLNRRNLRDNPVAVGQIRAALGNNALVDLQACGTAAIDRRGNGPQNMQRIANVLRARVRGPDDEIVGFDDNRVNWITVSPQ